MNSPPLPRSVLIISGEPMDWPCVRYRCYHHQEQLALAGIPSTVQWIGSPAIDVNHDLIFLHRVQHDDFAAELISRARALGKILVYEADDMVFDPDAVRFLSCHFEGKVSQWIAEQEGHLETLKTCDCCVVSTQFLANRARFWAKEAYVVRNAFSAEELELARAVRRQPVGAGGRIVVGYMSGTSGHVWNFAEASRALACIMRKHRQVYLQVTGPFTLPADYVEFGERVRLVPYMPWRRCYEIYGSLDINLAPLEMREAFCQGKSELKFIEAGMVGVPTVASSTEAYRQAMVPGTTGLLAANHDEWVAALDSLVTHPAEIERLGRNAQARVLEEYSPEKRSVELLAAIKTIMERFARSGSVSGVPSGKRPLRTLVHRSDFGIAPASRPRLFPPRRSTPRHLLTLGRRILQYEGWAGLCRRLFLGSPARRIRAIFGSGRRLR